MRARRADSHLDDFKCTDGFHKRSAVEACISRAMGQFCLKPEGTRQPVSAPHRRKLCAAMDSRWSLTEPEPTVTHPMSARIQDCPSARPRRILAHVSFDDRSEKTAVNRFDSPVLRSKRTMMGRFLYSSAPVRRSSAFHLLQRQKLSPGPRPVSRKTGLRVFPVGLLDLAHPVVVITPLDLFRRDVVGLGCVQAKHLGA